MSAAAAGGAVPPRGEAVPPPGEAPPPRLAVGWLGWARANLFGSWLNALLTVVALALALRLAAGVGDWALLQAVWRGPPQACQARPDGACWAMLQVWGRFILFGRYPPAEHWRPALAVLLIIAAAALSWRRRLWGRPLALIWGAAAAGWALLMWGGVAGLPRVGSEAWGGLPLTLFIAIISLVGAAPLGVLLALARRSALPVYRSLATGYIEPVRGVPLISVLIVASVMFPLFLPPDVTLDKLLRTIAGFTLFEAAYLAEVVRGGLIAIPRGQYEAADALGLGYWRRTRLVILPQALRLVIPPLVGSFISAFKDTSLVIVAGLFDLLNTAKTALVDPTWRAYYREAYMFVGLIYFCFCFFMSRFARSIEAELNAGRERA